MQMLDQAERSTHEDGILLHDIAWWQYLAIREATEGRGLKLSYLEGDLEIMSPSELHEESKKLIARLLETWAVERDLDLRGFGSTTWRSEAGLAGLEADECYKLGKLERGALPDLAIEITVSRERLDKLKIYARLGIQEVWRWNPRAARVSVSRLVAGEYIEQTRSVLLPELDLEKLAEFVRVGESQTQLIKAYRATL
ncbi:MAG TPA: Uma2 family endonuclease [Polyangiales bacterium]|nr:Uma2 family endonuclease [Polyangiales bacterium]